MQSNFDISYYKSLLSNIHKYIAKPLREKPMKQFISFGIVSLLALMQTSAFPADKAILHDAEYSIFKS